MLSVLLASLGSAERIGSFIVLGDWGYDQHVHCSASSGCGMNPGCQQAIGNKMKEWVSQNSDVKFVINVGDSFYPNGVSSLSDSQWQTKWKNVYGDQITNLKWFGVYGNHDYEGKDRCACGDPAHDPSLCAQRVTSGMNGWYMPDLYYHDESMVDSLGIEIVAMDTNSVAESACKYLPSGCSTGACWANLNARYKASMNMFADRMKQTRASSVIVFNHYPTVYFGGNRYSFIQGLKQGPANGGKIYFFGGHTHMVQNNYGTSISPQENWLVGGGGGWGCDGSAQGFVVGIIDRTNGRTTISLHNELVDHSTCCYHHLAQGLQTNGTAQKVESWVEENDNKIYRTEEWIDDQLKMNFDQTCGGNECKERREMLESWRAVERLQNYHSDGEAAKILKREREIESGADFEFDDHFHDTMAEVKEMIAARKAEKHRRHHRYHHTVREE